MVNSVRLTIVVVVVAIAISLAYDASAADNDQNYDPDAAAVEQIEEETANKRAGEVDLYIRLTKSGSCAVIGTKCFNTRQCCDGFICAILDEEDGNKPEVPGVCVKSKDLQTCSSGGGHAGDECPSGHRCMAPGRIGQRYCLPIGGGMGGGAAGTGGGGAEAGGAGVAGGRLQAGLLQMPEFRSIRITDRRRYHGPGASKAIGKLGSACITDLDCSPTSEDGTHRMCCQLVNQGRQGTKRICDRVTPISTCTNA